MSTDPDPTEAPDPPDPTEPAADPPVGEPAASQDAAPEPGDGAADAATGAEANPPDGPPPSASLIEAAAAAIGRAVKLAKLEPGPVAQGEDGDHTRPLRGAVLVSFTVTGALRGTVTLAVEDELADRLVYAAGSDNPAVGLAPLADAMVKAMAEAGPFEAEPLVEIDPTAAATAWPGPAPHLSTVALLGKAEDAEADDEPVAMVAVALAATHHPPAPEPDDDDGEVSGRGTASLSMSGQAAGRPALRPTGSLTAEGRRLGAVEVTLSGVLGETTVLLHELLNWLPGVIVTLHRDVGMPVDVRIDDATVAHAEIVVVDERYALRVLDVVAKAQARLAQDQGRTAQDGPAIGP